jgi:hypothetical protein
MKFLQPCLCLRWVAIGMVLKHLHRSHMRLQMQALNLPEGGMRTMACPTITIQPDTKTALLLVHGRGSVTLAAQEALNRQDPRAVFSTGKQRRQVLAVDRRLMEPLRVGSPVGNP